MTVLTWRDVAAPNFSGVQDGFQNFGELVNKGFAAAKGGIADWQRAQQDAANNSLLADVAAAPDANAAQALLASIGSRRGAADLSPDAIKFAMGRPADLTKQAGDVSDLNWTNYNRDQKKTADAAEIAASPILQQASLLAGSGKHDEAIKLVNDHPEVFGKMKADDFFAHIKELQGVSGTDTSLRSGRFGYDTAVRDDKVNQDAIKLVNELRSTGLTKEDFAANFETTRQKLLDSGYSPAAIERARATLMGESPSDDSLGGGAAGVGGGNPGNAATVANYEARAAGFGGIPDTVQNLGQWSDWATQVNKNGVKSSAAGLFQITGDTLRDFAPRVLGAGWKNAAFTPENQDKIARAIFEDAKGNPNTLRTRWTSLSASEAAAIAKLPWEQARNVIAQGESGASNVADIIAQHAQTTVGVTAPQYARSQDPAQIAARAMVEAFKSDADPRTVAAQLAGKDGVLAGENIGNVSGLVKQIAQQYHVSPAVAGAMLAKSVDQNKNWYQRGWDNLKGVVGGGDGLASHVDWDQIDQLGKMAQNPGALLRQVAATDINDQSSAAAAASQQAATAAQQVAANRARMAARLGRKVDVSAALAQAATASATRNDALANAGAVARAGVNQPQSTPPAAHNPTPVARSGGAAPAKQAQTYLLRQFQNMIPNGAGPLQIQGVKQQFKDQFGVSIDQVKANPNLAWDAAKKADNKAAELLRAQVGVRNANFRR